MPPKRVHILGIGGVGMSALALLLCQEGVSLTGSDLRESPLLDRVRARGARVRLAPAPALAAQAGWLVVPDYVPEGHPEVEAAQASKTPILRRGEALEIVVGTMPRVLVRGQRSLGPATLALATTLPGSGLFVGALPRNGGPHARLPSAGAPFVMESPLRNPCPRGAAAALFPDLEDDRTRSSFPWVGRTPHGFESDRGETLSVEVLQADLCHTSLRLRAASETLTIHAPPGVESCAMPFAGAIALSHLLKGCSLSAAFDRLQAAGEEVLAVGHFEVRSSAQAVVHDVRTHPEMIGAIIEDMRRATGRAPLVVYRPYAPTLNLHPIHAFAEAFSGARGVCILPPYPGPQSAEKLAELLGIPSFSSVDEEALLENHRDTRAILFLGGDDLAALAEELSTPALKRPSDD